MQILKCFAIARGYSFPISEGRRVRVTCPPYQLLLAFEIIWELVG